MGQTSLQAENSKILFLISNSVFFILGIPKQNSIFEFQVKGYVFEIFGSNFRFRPGERSARKFKPKLFMAF